MRYIRDHVQFPVSEDYFRQRRAAGWRLSVIEWENNDPSEEHDIEQASQQVPYGLKLVSGSVLITNSQEITVLLTILEMIVKDRSAPVIAEELNQRGYRTRAGNSWTAPVVFDLLPRVIEMGPSLLQSQEWISLRQTITAL